MNRAKPKRPPTERSGFGGLGRLAQVVTASLALGEVLAGVARAVTGLTDDASARIWVAEQGRIALRAEAGTRGPHGEGRKTVLDLGEGLTGHVALSRQPLLVDDVRVDPRTVNREWMRRERLVSYIGLPLVVRDQLVGVLSLLVRRRHRFTTEEIEALTSFGSQAAIAIHNARLFEEAQARETFIRNVVESLAEGLVVLDRAGRVMTWNHAMERVCGIGAAEASGRPFLEVCADLGRAVAEPLGRLLAGEIEEFFLEAVEHACRGRVVLNIKGRRLAERGAPTGATLLVEDISERVALVQAARQAEKMAALGMLCAGIAHEINNPIGIMTSRIELMLLGAEGQTLPAEVRQDLAVLRRHAQRLARITGRLLSFARPSPPAPAPLDLGRVVQDTLLLVESQMAKDGIRVLADVTPGLPPLLGDANALQQVVLNVLTNAREAMPGGGEIRIEMGPVPPRRDRVRLAVRDTGSGIAPEHLPKIFDPFFTTKPDGTGLGLSMSYAIVRDHGGTVDVQSEPGKGTTFVFTFPAARPGPA